MNEVLERLSDLFEWVKSDGPASWIGLFLSVGAGTFAGGSAVARARMRLEDRRTLRDSHLRAINGLVSETDRRRFKDALAHYEFDSEDDVEFVVSALAKVEAVSAAGQIFPLLSLAERTMWSAVLSEIESRSNEAIAYEFLTSFVSDRDDLPIGFRVEGHRRRFISRFDMPPQLYDAAASEFHVELPRLVRHGVC